jgi:hypothetical protein
MPKKTAEDAPDLGLTPSTTNNPSVKTHFNSLSEMSSPPRAELHTAFSLDFCNVEVGSGGCKIIAFNPLNGIESQEAYGLIEVQRGRVKESGANPHYSA